MDSLEDHFALENLERIWAAFKRNRFDVYEGEPRVATGSDNIDLAAFERDVDKHLRALQRKVLEDRYTFAPFREVDVEKPGGGTRTLSIGTIRDAICQLAIYDYLYERVDGLLTESVFGYRRGRGVHNAVKAVRAQITNGALHVLDADIQKFFDNLDHELLIAKVNELGIDPRACNLLLRFIKTPGDKVQHPELKARRRAKGVPQGGILSGLLTNLYLAAFDRHVVDRYPGYVRYADDFVVTCKSTIEAGEARDFVDGLLRDLRLQLHGSPKTECRPISRGFDFLGFRFSESRLSIKQANIRKFKARVDEVIANIPATLSPVATLNALAFRIGRKIQGPAREFIEPLMALGQLDHPHRRNWMAFFRVIDDEAQIKALDNWIRARVSRCMWARHRNRVSLSQMQGARLPTLFGQLWKARKPAPRRASQTLPAIVGSSRQDTGREAHQQRPDAF